MLSASLVVIMLLHEGMTHIHSQKKPRLLFGETPTLTVHMYSIYVAHYAHMLGTNDDFFCDSKPECTNGRFVSVYMNPKGYILSVF